MPEITLIPVKLTLCKVSGLMLSPGFSIFTFSLDKEQTKKSAYSFIFFPTLVLWYTLLLLTWLKHPGELIYDPSPQGTKSGPAAGEI